MLCRSHSWRCDFYRNGTEKNLLYCLWTRMAFKIVVLRSKSTLRSAAPRRHSVLSHFTAVVCCQAIASRFMNTSATACRAVSFPSYADEILSGAAITETEGELEWA
jgi:hypothetical protein